MRILLIEDDRNLNETLVFQLEKEGFQVDSCFSGEEGLYYIEQHTADLILLDRMLPGLSGTELLKRLRSGGDNTPVLMLTALGTLAHRVEGLNLGADDYLVKPFATEELLARIRSLLRRTNPQDLLLTEELRLSDLCFSPDTGELTGKLGSCTLSRRESALLEVFLRSPGQTLGRGRLLSRVWGMDSEVEDGNLDNYIFFLRRRLKAVSKNVMIQTVRGFGYQIKENETHEK